MRSARTSSWKRWAPGARWSPARTAYIWPARDGTVELEGAVEAYALRDGGRPFAVCVYDGEHWGACDLDGQEILPYEYDSVASDVRRRVHRTLR